MGSGFVGRGVDGAKVWLHASKSADVSQRVRDLRWGDFLNVVAHEADGWTQISWGGQPGFLRTDRIVATRPLEIVFVDVGQGDGCIVVSPETGGDERILVIDAGEDDNMLGMLAWRFGKLSRPFDFHAAVITHPDQDHYQGFAPIFAHPNVRFERLYHNGLVERAGADPLGPSDAARRHLVGLAQTHAQMDAAYPPGGPDARKQYGRLMRAALDGGRVARVQMLSTRHATQEGGRAWLPGFAPSDGRRASIEVLGPVPDLAADGTPMLRWFGNDIGSRARHVARTKNGHSVLLRLQIGALRVLLGGDLNRPAEDYLLRRYGGIAENAPLADAVAPASARLGAEILKCCHHGAADVTDAFLQAVNPFAFVVSSGDEESHAHPRPDLLGRLGKHGRGDAPLILCTEMLRSTRESGRSEDFARLHSLDARIDADATPAAERERAQRERADLQARIQKRNVGVYGAITLRSDGEHAELSFMLERPRGRQRWQTYRLERNAQGEWRMAGGDHD